MTRIPAYRTPQHALYTACRNLRRLLVSSSALDGLFNSRTVEATEPRVKPPVRTDWTRSASERPLCPFERVMCVAVLVVIRAFHVQIASGDRLRGMAEDQHLRHLRVSPRRGVIYDRDGAELAVSADQGPSGCSGTAPSSGRSTRS